MNATEAVRVGVPSLLAIGLALVLHQIVTRRLRGRLSMVEGRMSLHRERQRIAEDFHDELGARLARVSLLSELAATGGERTAKHLQGVTSAAQDAARSLDELVWALEPRHDSLAQLASYLSNYASEFLEDTPIGLRLDVASELPPLVMPAVVRHQLLQAWKEAMTNAAKHARATEIHLAIAAVDRQVMIRVTDNGTCEPTAPKQKRVGRGTMKDRVERLGGTCITGPAHHGGTVVALTVPAQLA